MLSLRLLMYYLRADHTTGLPKPTTNSVPSETTVFRCE
jgi:hypothetical protein